MNETTDKSGAAVTAPKSPATQNAAPQPGPKGQIRRKQRLKWLIALLLVLALTCGGGYWVYTAGHRGDADQGYRMYTVGLGDIPVSISKAAVLEPREQRTVAALVTGEVRAAAVEKGQAVEKGDLLYSIDPSSAAETLRQAELALSRAQRAREEAERQAADLTVSAPVGGLVTALNVRNGDMAAPDAPIATVADPDALTITLPFLARDAAAIAVGQGAQVALAATGETLSGVVARISTGTYANSAGALVANVVVDFENPGAVSPGEKATAQVGGSACNQPGEIAFRTERTVRARGSGEVTGLVLIVGDRVAQGEELAVLENSGVMAALETAELALAEARANVTSARDRLKDFEIYAPIAGTVVTKNLGEGDKVGSANMGDLAVIADLTQLVFPMEVDEMDIAAVRPGQTVTVTADAYPEDIYRAAVASVDPMGSASGGVTTFAVRVALSAYGDLRPGMNVTAEIAAAGAVGVVVIPTEALLEGKQVLLHTGAAAPVGTEIPEGYERRRVETGRSADGYVEIISGLNAGDVIGIKAAP